MLNLGTCHGNWHKLSLLLFLIVSLSFQCRLLPSPVGPVTGLSSAVSPGCPTLPMWMRTVTLAVCDPMQRMNCEADSLPESCFDSGLSTLRDSNKYDSKVEDKHQRCFQRLQCTQESFGGNTSDTDVSPRNHCTSRPYLQLNSVTIFNHLPWYRVKSGCIVSAMLFSWGLAIF